MILIFNVESCLVLYSQRSIQEGEMEDSTPSFKQFLERFASIYRNKTSKLTAFDVSTPHPPKTFAHFPNDKNFPSSITVLTFFLLPSQHLTFNENLYSQNSLLKYTRIKFLPASIRKFCIDIVQTTVEERERHGTVRKDLMQSLIQLRNNNNIEHSDEFKLSSGGMNTKSI